MRRSPAQAWAATSLLLLSLPLALAAPAAASGVAVAFTPTTLQVEPGAVFDLDLTVLRAGAAFNGFETIVGWDPQALTPLARAEGTLMTEACGTRFHRLRPGASADTVAVALLCSGVSVTGPGPVYRWRFQASLTPQVTAVLFLSGPQFYDAGLFLPLDVVGEAAIGIGMTPVAVGAGPDASQLRLRAAPNPTRGGTVFTFATSGTGPQRLWVADVRGRVVRQLDAPAGAPGIRSVAWDGRDAGGRRLPPGIYLVTLEAGGTAVSSRVALLR